MKCLESVEEFRKCYHFSIFRIYPPYKPKNPNYKLHVLLKLSAKFSLRMVKMTFIKQRSHRSTGSNGKCIKHAYICFPESRLHPMLEAYQNLITTESLIGQVYEVQGSCISPFKVSTMEQDRSSIPSRRMNKSTITDREGM